MKIKCEECGSVFDRSHDFLYDKVLCPECKNAKEEHRKLTSRSHRLKNNYGITIDEERKIFKDQGYKCKICKAPLELASKGRKNMTNLDHDHLTGKVRGILCTRCNSMLAIFDDRNTLEKGLKYIFASRNQPQLIIEVDSLIEALFVNVETDMKHNEGIITPKGGKK